VEGEAVKRGEHGKFQLESVGLRNREGDEVVPAVL